jgi:predicted nucleic acid-binding protein
MNLLVDTSVWSLVLRRDSPPDLRQVRRLRDALEHDEELYTTGLVLQELLQGFDGPKAKDLILGEFHALPMLVPDRDDHVAAAELRNAARRRGLQLGTIDALLAQLAIRHDLMLLSTDEDFGRLASWTPLRLFGGA